MRTYRLLLRAPIPITREKRIWKDKSAAMVWEGRFLPGDFYIYFRTPFSLKDTTGPFE
jgi:hypothetical protein